MRRAVMDDGRGCSTVALLLLITFSCQVSGEIFTLGLISGNTRRDDNKVDFMLPGLRISPAIALAVDDVNNKALLPEPHKLRYVLAETHGDESQSILATAELWRSNVSAYIGPQESCLHESQMASAFNKPMISHFCTSHEATKSPLFARTVPPATHISDSTVALLTSFNWTRVAFLYSNTSEEQSHVAEALKAAFKAHKIDIVHTKCWKELVHFGYQDNQMFHKFLEETKRDVRIYVVQGESDAHLSLLEAMHESEMFERGEDYFVVGLRTHETWAKKDPGRHLRGFLQHRATRPRRAVIKGMRHYVALMATPATENALWSHAEFVRRVKKYYLINNKTDTNNGNGGNFSSWLSAKSVSLLQLRPEAAFLYDAVMVYTRALAEVLKKGGDAHNGDLIMQHIVNRDYLSAMGYRVFMDGHGDSRGNYSLYALHRSNSSKGARHGLRPVGLFTLAKSSPSRLPKLVLHKTLRWPTDSGLPPPAIPACGFEGELCESHLEETELFLTALAFLALALIVASSVVYRNYRYEQALDSLLWKIDPKELRVHDIDSNNNKANSNRNVANSQVSLGSNMDPPLCMSEPRLSCVYAPIGVFRGRIYAVKSSTRSVDLNRALKKELKMLRELRHDNLNAFVGACVEPGNVWIVSEYCTRGSLRDVLANTALKLDALFVASLVKDLVRGLVYLHESPVRFHARLKTANCLVDSRWVLKIADFGIRSLRTDVGQSVDVSGVIQGRVHIEAAECEELLYRAPELLRQPELLDVFPLETCVSTSSRSTRTTSSLASHLLCLQRADVYSLAMVVHEIYLRTEPSLVYSSLSCRVFGEPHMSSRQVLERVYTRRSNIAFRPRVDQLHECPDFVRRLLKQCWHELPDFRPDLKTIRMQLRPLCRGLKANIVDNMLAMMETYANNLESIVDERTAALSREKQRTDALLHQMLPKTVATQLTQGRVVDAESYSCVTIYFSDVVGFTLMCAESTPLEVVAFLNDLYTLFDKTIENFDVYKVETIGDAYMVVSGLPVRNADDHAAEIASMALTLLEQVRHFSIRHRPSDTLMLRAGIHSGPVCAGVVGSKMPRYCLFGDTVNVASRMETTGIPLRVHCSSACAEVLRRLGGFELSERGLVHIKGKGDQLTFWLVSEDAGMRETRRHKREQRRQQVEEVQERGQGSLLVPLSSPQSPFDSHQRFLFNDMALRQVPETTSMLNISADLRVDKGMTTSSALDVSDAKRLKAESNWSHASLSSIIHTLTTVKETNYRMVGHKKSGHGLPNSLWKWLVARKDEDAADNGDNSNFFDNNVNNEAIRLIDVAVNRER